MARSVTDLAILLDTTIGHDPADPVTAPMAARRASHFQAALRPGGLRGARIGVLRDLLKPADLDREVSRTIDASLQRVQAQGAELVDVAVPGLEDALKGARLLAFEFRRDFAAFLARYPGAPIADIQDIVANGLVHDAVAAGLERISTAPAIDAKAYDAALAKRELARTAILRAMDAARVDVIAYPTSTHPPALWGSGALGKGNCSISTASGLPALALPLGLSADALPVGIEFLGRPFSEGRLLELGYGWEQAAHPRTPPSTTPPLRDRKPPGAPRFDVKVGARPATVADVRFRLDVGTSTLFYHVKIEQAGGDRAVATTLQIGDSRSAGPVIAVLLRNDIHASGRVQLEPRWRRELAAGRLYLHLYTKSQPLSAGRAVLPPQ